MSPVDFANLDRPSYLPSSPSTAASRAHREIALRIAEVGSGVTTVSNITPTGSRETLDADLPCYRCGEVMPAGSTFRLWRKSFGKARPAHMSCRWTPST